MTDIAIACSEHRPVPTLAFLVLAIAGILLLFSPVQAGILDASWTAPTTHVDDTALTDLASYRVYYSTSPTPCSDSTYFHVDAKEPEPPPDETVFFRLTGLEAGQMYYVTVTAITIGGAEGPCVDPPESAVAGDDPSGAPTLSVDTAVAAPGAPVSVTLTNGLWGALDWLGLAATTDPDTTYLDWVYVGEGVTSTIWTVNMPQAPGAYHFRLFVDDGFTRVATSPTVIVAPR